MRPLDRHVKQPITVHFVQCHVSGRGNVTTIREEFGVTTSLFPGGTLKNATHTSPGNPV